MNDKKKYYMRGLGFGILVATVIMMLVHSDDRMTDERAVKRAKELGYVLATDVTGTPSQTINMEEIKAKLTETPKPTEVALLTTPEAKVTETPNPTETPLPTVTPEPTETPTPTKTQIPTSTPKPSQIVFATATPSLTPTPFPTATATPTPTPVPAVTLTPTPLPPVSTPTPYPASGDVIVAEITVEYGMPSYKVCSLVVNAGIVKDGDALSKYASYKGLEGKFQVGTFVLRSDMTYNEILSILTGSPVE